MTTQTHTIAVSENDTVAALTVAVATTTDAHELVAEGAPTQPIQIRQLSRGWVGAEWVRYVADYQDHASVGYATLEDLETDHQWTAEMGADFEPVRLPVVKAFKSSHFPLGGNLAEEMLVLADGRAVFLSPEAQDLLCSSEKEARAHGVGEWSESPSLLAAWSDGYSTSEA